MFNWFHDVFCFVPGNRDISVTRDMGSTWQQWARGNPQRTGHLSAFHLGHRSHEESQYTEIAMNHSAAFVDFQSGKTTTAVFHYPVFSSTIWFLILIDFVWVIGGREVRTTQALEFACVGSQVIRKQGSEFGMFEVILVYCGQRYSLISVISVLLCH